MEINQEKAMRKDTRSDLLVLINTLDNIDDLREVRTMVKDKLESLGRATKYNLVIGDKVRISGSPKIEKGKIIKINRTKAVVDCFNHHKEHMGEWTVPFSMIVKLVNQDEEISI
jgi:FKBP-type peptidyl-prolyl cis-trans isomerase 2